MPVKPSPLESGDELLGREQFSEALAEYERQVLSDANTDAGQELRYKKSLCLVRLNRSDDAIAAFRQLTAEPGSRWPLLAACQLWLLQLLSQTCPVARQNHEKQYWVANVCGSKKLWLWHWE